MNNTQNDLETIENKIDTMNNTQDELEQQIKQIKILKRIKNITEEQQKQLQYLQSKGVNQKKIKTIKTKKKEKEKEKNTLKRKYDECLKSIAVLVKQKNKDY